MLFSLGSLGT